MSEENKKEQNSVPTPPPPPPAPPLRILNETFSQKEKNSNNGSDKE